MFRRKKYVPVPYNQQGYIYFLCKNYKHLPSAQQHLIQDTAMAAGGEHYKALLEYLTTDHGRQIICSRHAICEMTLDRAVKRFYCKFAAYL